MWYTKEEASEKYPGVEFGGDVWIGDRVLIESGVRIGRGSVIGDAVGS